MTEQSFPDRPRRVPELDGIRGIAILMVMLYHFKIYGSGWNSSTHFGWYHLCNFGWAGVNVFFVLSGLLITGILFDAQQNKSYYRVFYARRTLRIFPLYYVSLAIAFFALPRVLEGFGLVGVARQLQRTPQLPAWCYVQNWTTALAKNVFVSTLISHFWSLCVEEQFYIVWPLCIRRLAQRRPIMILAAGLIIVAPFMRWIMHQAGFVDAAYILTVCQMDALALGALLALSMRGEPEWALIRRWAPWLAGIAAAGVIAIILISHRIRYGGKLMDTAGFSLIDLLAGAVLVLVMTGRETAWHVRLARSRFLRFFGKYSYGLYVIHQPVIYLMASVGVTAAALAMHVHGAGPAIVLMNVMGFSVSLALALSSWHLIEKPCLKLKDRIGPEPVAVRSAEGDTAAGLRA